MYTRTQAYTLQTHGASDEEPASSTSRDNRSQQVIGSSNVNARPVYMSMQQYTLQTHGVPNEEPMPSTSGENLRPISGSSKVNGGGMYARTQQYTLQNHSLPNGEPVASTSGENRRQVTEPEEEQDVNAARKMKRMPEKRTRVTQSNESTTDPNYGKKQKVAPSCSGAPHTTRSDEASPDELYFSALGGDEANPWPRQRQPERAAPVAADSTGWSRPATESAPAEPARGALQQAAPRSSALSLAVAECLDSLTGLDPNALYQIDYVPPKPARLTFRRVDAPSLPPPPRLYPYGVPEGYQRACGNCQQREADEPVWTAAPGEEARPDTRRPANATARPTPNQRPPSGTEAWPYRPHCCHQMPLLQEQVAPVIKYVREMQTNTCCTRESQTDFPEPPPVETSDKCCTLIDVDRVTLFHNAPHNRGQTTVLDVDHVRPSNFSTPNNGGGSKTVAPTSGVRPLAAARPPEERTPKQKQQQQQQSSMDHPLTPNTPCGEITRDRNSSTTPTTTRGEITRKTNSSDSDSSDFETYSIANSKNTSFSSYPNTPIYRE